MKPTLTSIIIAAALMTWGAGEALAQPGPALASMTLTVLTGSVPLVGSYNIYYGHLHNHSNLSDGSGTPEQAYTAAQAAGLDFFSLADHGYYLDADEYQLIVDTANSHNQEDVFTTFWGFEWTSGTYGHLAVIGSPDHCNNANPSTFAGLTEWLETRDCIAFFNHPGRNDGSGLEFEHFVGAYSDKIVGMELWNKGDLFNTYYYNSGYDTSDTTDRSGYFDEALLNGWQIGAAGSEDNHNGTWGSSNNRLAVLANANTRADLYAALQARRFYSTLDKNLALSFEVDGQAMGSEIAGGLNACVIEAADGDGESFSEIELIHNSNIVQIWSSSEFDPAHPLVSYDLTTGQGDYIYCKVTEADGDEAISSPVFVVIDGPPQAELIVPQDNGPDDLEPDDDEVTVNTTQSSFQIQLTDVGDGIDDGTVLPATVALTKDDVLLTESTDYSFSYDDVSDVVTLTPLAGDFGNGLYVITLSDTAKIKDLAGNEMVTTTLAILIDTSIVPPVTLTFQQGVDGYESMVDTMIRFANPDENYADSATQYDQPQYQYQINADTDSGGGPSHVLLRFDDVISPSGPIPAGSQIVSATVRIRSTDDGNGGRLHPVLLPWVDTEVTWNNSFGGNGVQANDTEAASAADDSIGQNLPDTDVDFDVTATVQAWADGAVNDGWAILPNGSNGWHMAAAEHPTLDWRPELIVEFITTGNRPPVADAGPDQTVTDSDENSVEMVTLDGSGSYDPTPGGSIVSYEWDTDGDGFADYEGETVDDVPFGLGTHTVTLTVQDDEGASDTDDVVITVNPGHVDNVASSDIPVNGTIVNSYLDTQTSNGVYEAITETQSGGGQPKNLRSSLEHKWTFNVMGGNVVTFYIEAHHTANSEGDDFVFAYSIDNSTYTDMLTVSKTSDDDTYQTYGLPSSISGTVYIRVQDTDQTRGNGALDTIYVDHMYVECRGTPIPDTTPPSPDPMTWATPPHATGSTSIAMTATTASDLSGVEYYFACTGGGHDSGWQDSPTYEDTGLETGVQYTYQVKARDKSPNQNETDWSSPASATPGEQQTVHVESIYMTIQSGKKYYATATVQIAPELTGATVVGDWYFKGTLRASGATGLTDASGSAELSSFETPAKSGDVFTFVVTDVVLSGYTYDAGQGVTQGSIAVP